MQFACFYFGAWLCWVRWIPLSEKSYQEYSNESFYASVYEWNKLFKEANLQVYDSGWKAFQQVERMGYRNGHQENAHASVFQ